jgi:hypothetical protein
MTAIPIGDRIPEKREDLGQTSGATSEDAKSNSPGKERSILHHQFRSLPIRAGLSLSIPELILREYCWTRYLPRRSRR